MIASLLLTLARVGSLAVTVVLATVGSLGLGFGVMTGCTSTTSQCAAPQVILVAGWLAQVVFAAVAVSLFLPTVGRRLSRRRLVVVALAVPVLAAATFLGTGWAASSSYCLEGQAPRDYCDVEPRPGVPTPTDRDASSVWVPCLWSKCEADVGEATSRSAGKPTG